MTSVPLVVLSISGKDDVIEALTPLDRLLVECVRADLPEPSGGELEAVAEACRNIDDWSAVPERASYQGVAAWAHEVFLKLEDGVVPADVLERLREIRLHQAAMLMAMKPMQDRLFTAFSEAGIEFIVLKGPVLAEKVYPAPELRSYTDIDLLIREKSLSAAGKTLSLLGYRLVEEDRTGHFEKDRTQVHYFREGSLPIDLHWQVINLPSHGPSITIDNDEVWRSSQSGVVGGSEVRVLSPEDLLLFQCAHLTGHHDFNRLLWFKDVQQAAVRFRDEIDWDIFIERALRYHLKTFTYYALLMTSEVCGGALAPARALASLRPNNLTARLFERLIRRNNILEMQSARRRPALEVWRAMRDDRRERYGAVLRRTFPSVEWYLECYPFLPKIKHQKLYYGVYPALMCIRVLKRPADINLSDTLKSR